MKCDLELIYYFIDQFIKNNELNFSFNERARLGRMTLSELVTLRVWFQMSQVKTFKAFCYLLKTIDNKAFPSLVSYERLILWQPRIMVAVQELMQVLLSTTDELNALDSTALPLTQYNKKGKIMAYEADIGHKTQEKWFYGFKAHVLINSKAELVEVWITKASVADITPVKQGILLFCHGIVTADKGYISKDIKDNLHNKGCNFWFVLKQTKLNNLLMWKRKHISLELLLKEFFLN